MPQEGEASPHICLKTVCGVAVIARLLMKEGEKKAIRVAWPQWFGLMTLLMTTLTTLLQRFRQHRGSFS